MTDTDKNKINILEAIQIHMLWFTRFYCWNRCLTLPHSFDKQWALAKIPIPGTQKASARKRSLCSLYIMQTVLKNWLELSISWFITYLVSNDNENIPNTLAGVSGMLHYTTNIIPISIVVIKQLEARKKGMKIIGIFIA